MIAPPPSEEDLRIGHKLIAGLTESTVLPDIDFETYSEAGYVWDSNLRKFVSLRGARDKGLQTVGMAVYSEHPSTEVICFAYNLKDGFGARQWRPGDAYPIDLFIHLEDGGLLEAWNVAFEYYIWNSVCVRKYGWPVLMANQLRCAASKSRAFALPGSLEACGKVLDIKNKKLTDGKRLIKKYCEPRNPTKHIPELRNNLRDNIEDFQLMLRYNAVDIKAEAELSNQIPDLSPTELEFWLADQRINYRGVRLDRKMIECCIAIAEQAFKKYTAELVTITENAVTSISQIARIMTWMKEYGVFTKSLDEEHINELLSLKIPDPVRRVLEIRQLIGSAAVKKLFAMINRLSYDDRMRDLFVYHAARTGRAGGNGVQPQNLPNNNSMYACRCLSCDKYFGTRFVFCPWCGEHYTSKPHEWNPKAIDSALEIIATGRLNCLEYYFGEAISTISGCLRGMFIPADGHDFISSDYAAIEGIVLPQLAGEEWHLEVYRTHGMMYEMTASKITGVPMAEFIRVKQETGKHHELRKLGKVAALACFSPDTQVLTDRGYVDIKEIRQSDKLWDGVEWVNHKGAIYKGKRKVIVLDGVKMTPQHPISLGNSWKEANILASNESILCQALEIGSENLPLLPLKNPKKSEFNVRVVLKHMSLLLGICVKVNPLVVIFVLKRKLEKRILNSILYMPMFYPIKNTEDDWLIDYEPQLGGVITLKIPNTKITVVEGFSFVKNGVKKLGNFYSILLQLKDGIFPSLKWIGQTLIKDMNLVISDLYQKVKMRLIKEKLATSNVESKNLKNVYDIVNAGPRNRFTIKTNSGHLIVHNSGYQGYIGAWLKFKADEFLTEDEIKKSVLAWRDASPNIVRMWKELETCAHMATIHANREFSYRSITYIRLGNVLYCKLPSGRNITYHRPQLAPNADRPGTMQLSFEGWNTDPKKGVIGWCRMTTYGGKLTENVVQAVARDILAHAIVRLEKIGYPVVLHVHDEIVCEVPEGLGCVEEVEAIMSAMPEWAKGWPIKAAGGWRAKRYQK